MPHPTAPHGDERLPSRLTQRAPGVPGDDPHPGYAGSRLLDDPIDGALRPASMPEPPPGLEPGDASLSLPIGSSLAGARGRHPGAAGEAPTGVGPSWQAGGHTLGSRIGGERAAAGRGDSDRAARDDHDNLDGPAGL